MLMRMSSYSLSVSVACSPYTACLVSKRFDVYINPYIHKQILFIDFTYMQQLFNEQDWITPSFITVSPFIGKAFHISYMPLSSYAQVMCCGKTNQAANLHQPQISFHLEEIEKTNKQQNKRGGYLSLVSLWLSHIILLAHNITYYVPSYFSFIPQGLRIRLHHCGCLVLFIIFVSFFASVALSAFDDYCVVHSRPYHAMLFTRMYIGSGWKGARSTCMEYGQLGFQVHRGLIMPIQK